MLSEDLKIDEDTGDEGGDWSFCEGRIKGHERFGSCQQGLSATFTKDYHYLVFGAPGGFNWKGGEWGGEQMRRSEDQEQKGWERGGEKV